MQAREYPGDWLLAGYTHEGLTRAEMQQEDAAARDAQLGAVKARVKATERKQRRKKKLKNLRIALVAKGDQGFPDLVAALAIDQVQLGVSTSSWTGSSSKCS